MSILPSLVVVGGTVLDGAIQLVLERSAPWSAADAKQIEEIVADFVGAGAFAAYPAPKIDPGKQELEITAAAQVAGARMSIELRAKHLDARAFQILRQMVSRPDSDDGELRHMHVVGSTPGLGTSIQYPPIDFDNEADQYPDPPAKPGFHVVWDDEGSFSKSRRVLVEFPGVVEGKVVDELSAYVAAWGKLLDRGAFALPLGLPDVIYSVMGPVVVFDAITFEIEIPVYNGSELGFEVLLHVLSTYHLRVAPIRVVTID